VSDLNDSAQSASDLPLAPPRSRRGA